MKKFFLILMSFFVLNVTGCGGSSEEAKELLQHILKLVGIPQEIVVNICQDKNHNGSCDKGELQAKVTVNKTDSIAQMWEKVVFDAEGRYVLENYDPALNIILEIEDKVNLNYDNGKLALRYNPDTEELSVLQAIIDADFLKEEDTTALKALKNREEIDRILLDSLRVNQNLLKDENLSTNNALSINLEEIAKGLLELNVSKELPEQLAACEEDNTCIQAILENTTKEVELTPEEAEELARNKNIVDGYIVKLTSPVEAVCANGKVYQSSLNVGEKGKVNFEAFPIGTECNVTVPRGATIDSNNNGQVDSTDKVLGFKMIGSSGNRHISPLSTLLFKKRLKGENVDRFARMIENFDPVVAPERIIRNTGIEKVEMEKLIVLMEVLKTSMQQFEDIGLLDLSGITLTESNDTIDDLNIENLIVKLPTATKESVRERADVIKQLVTMLGDLDPNKISLNTFFISVSDGGKSIRDALTQALLIPLPEGMDILDFVINVQVKEEDTNTDSEEEIKEDVKNELIAINSIPTAEAGVDQNVTEGTIVTLDGSKSQDSDGEIASYVWREGEILLGEGASISINDLSVGLHTITLLVKDNDNALSNDTVNVVIEEISTTIVDDGKTTDFVDDDSNTTTVDDGNTTTVDDGNTTTVDDGNTTTVDDSNTTTVDDGNTTTVDDSNTTTVDDGNTTTVDDGNTTTVDDGNTTTVDDGNTTTVDDGNTTTVDDGNTTTVDDGNTTTVDDGNTTTVDDSNTTTVDDGNTTTVDDGNTTTVDDGNTSTSTSNEPPIANAGVDQTVESGSSVTLDGSLSSDVNGSIATYTWSSSGIVLSTSVSFSKIFEEGQHTVTLTVKDEDNASDSDDVIITVNPAPIVNTSKTEKNVADGYLIKLPSPAVAYCDSHEYNSSLTIGEQGKIFFDGVSLTNDCHIYIPIGATIDSNNNGVLDASDKVLNFSMKGSAEGTFISPLTSMLLQKEANGENVSEFKAMVQDFDPVTCASNIANGTGIEKVKNQKLMLLMEVLKTVLSEDPYSNISEINITSILQTNVNESIDDFNIDALSASFSSALQSLIYDQGTKIKKLMNTFASLDPTKIDINSFYINISDGGKEIEEAINASAKVIIDGTANLLEAIMKSDANLTAIYQEFLAMGSGTLTSMTKPIAQAGADVVVLEGEDVNLSGLASFDINGYIQQYTWTEGAVTLSPIALLNKNDFTVGSHELVLTVTDNDGISSSDSIVVTVNVNPNKPSVEESDYFITTWKTDNNGTSTNNQISIPTNSETYTYNYFVDWGDGTSDTNVSGDANHTYASAGTYTVKVFGEFPQIYFHQGYTGNDNDLNSDKRKLLSIEQWGNIQWHSMNGAFSGCRSLVHNASDNPNLFQVTNMDLMFLYASSFNGDISDWNVSTVTTMYGSFNGTTNFDQNLSSWNVSNVTDMTFMFSNVTLSTQNYDALLTGWSSQSLQSNVTFDGGSSIYSSSSASSRQSIIENFNWTITDGGLEADNTVPVAPTVTSEIPTMTEDSNISIIVEGEIDSNISMNGTVVGVIGADGNSTITLQLNNGVNNFSMTLIDQSGNESTPFTFSVTRVQESDYFITTWKTDNNGSSGDNQISIPTNSDTYTYNYSVDWGDGTTDTNISGDANHTYASAGTYTVKVFGEFPQVKFTRSGYTAGSPEISYQPLNDNLKLLSIEQWGTISWSSMEGSFTSCSNLELNATDTPNLINVNSMQQMFLGAIKSSNGNINNWDVSTITNMTQLFNESGFNSNIGNWNVSNVTTMSSMFSAKVGEINPFNQDISNWDVSNVTTMYHMFSHAKNFNQDISLWDVSSVTDMMGMFFNTTAFNQDLSSWNTSNVTNMYAMFDNATNFDQNLSSWDVSNVTDMSSMFSNVTLSTQNYDALLTGWSNQSLENNVVFDGGNSQYSSVSSSARQTLTDTFSWTITDGGEEVITASSSLLKKTGQTKSYDASGNEVTDGTQKDDGFYQKGADVNYTRDDFDEIVTDHLTGLVWQDDATVASVAKPWVTQENYDAGDYNNTTGDTATTYCAELVMNGFEDWRLPTRQELVGIADYGRHDPAINVVFVNTNSSYYWSSTSTSSSNENAWIVLFDYGSQDNYTKINNYYVRCVRAGQ